LSGAQWWLLEPSNRTIVTATAPGMAWFANVAIIKWGPPEASGECQRHVVSARGKG